MSDECIGMMLKFSPNIIAFNVNPHWLDEAGLCRRSNLIEHVVQSKSHAQIRLYATRPETSQHDIHTIRNALFADDVTIDDELTLSFLNGLETF